LLSAALPRQKQQVPYGHGVIARQLEQLGAAGGFGERLCRICDSASLVKTVSQLFFSRTSVNAEHLLPLCGIRCRQLRPGKSASKLSEKNTVPFKSEAQRRYFEANKSKLQKQGVDVKEWEESSKGLKLPERAPKAKSKKNR
jgi:hypothetical protein